MLATTTLATTTLAAITPVTIIWTSTTLLVLFQYRLVVPWSTAIFALLPFSCLLYVYWKHWWHAHALPRKVISLLRDWQLWQTTENASQHTYYFLRVVPTPSSPHNPKSYFNLTSTHYGIHMWAQHDSLCPVCCITEMARYAVGTIGTEQLCTQPLPEIKPYNHTCVFCVIFF